MAYKSVIIVVSYSICIILYYHVELVDTMSRAGMDMYVYYIKPIAGKFLVMISQAQEHSIMDVEPDVKKN